MKRSNTELINAIVAKAIATSQEMLINPARANEIGYQLMELQSEAISRMEDQSLKEPSWKKLKKVLQESGELTDQIYIKRLLQYMEALEAGAVK